MDGHAGKDLVVKVPCGTLVWRLPGSPAQSAGKRRC
jgi:GTPase involved in cell partitioning and DNA repair